MLIQSLVVSPWQSNCYLVATHEGATECLVIDPGVMAMADICQALESQNLTPAAVLATHGHLDHVGDAHLCAQRWQIPCYLAQADQHLLQRPGAGLGAHGDEIVQRMIGTTELPAIDDVRDWSEELELAGIRIEPMSAPGHTPGSTLLTLSAGQHCVTFTGDVIFAGTIGRVDFQGGSMEQMRQTLRRIVDHFPPDRVLMPGHGQPTTVARELVSNPYLQPNQM